MMLSRCHIQHRILDQRDPDWFVLFFFAETISYLSILAASPAKAFSTMSQGQRVPEATCELGNLYPGWKLDLLKAMGLSFHFGA